MPVGVQVGDCRRHLNGASRLPDVVLMCVLHLAGRLRRSYQYQASRLLSTAHSRERPRVNPHRSMVIDLLALVKEAVSRRQRTHCIDQVTNGVEF